MADTDDTSCEFESEVLSKEILEYIIADKNFDDLDSIEWDDSKLTVPEDLMSNWKTEVDPVTIEELTSRKAFGTGIFDAIMESIHNHLKIEYDSGRITGAEYATTYTKLTEAGLANAVQFTLQKNQAYFQGILAQAQAITAGIQAQIAAITAKVQLAKVKAEALGVAAQYALTTMKLATEDAQHALVCKQQAVADAQIAQTTAQTTLLGEQAAQVHEQAALAKYQARMNNPELNDGSNVDYLLKQKQLEDATNKELISEYQAKANNPSPSAADKGTNIDFLIKEAQLDTQENQSNVYEQQVKSYQRKSELDVAKIFSDAYIAMKTVDEGYPLPKVFTNRSINDVLQQTKVNIDLGKDDTGYDGTLDDEADFTKEANRTEENYKKYRDAGSAPMDTTEEESTNSSGD